MTRQEDLEAGTLVTFDDLSPHIGGLQRADVRTVLEREGVRIYENWAGEFAVTAADARRLRQAYAARRAEREKRDAAFQAWQERRRAEHRAKLREEDQKRREAQRREQQRVGVQIQQEAEQRAEVERRAREAERQHEQGDISRATFDRETGGA